MLEKLEKLIPWLVILTVYIIIFSFEGTTLKEVAADTGTNTSTVTVSNTAPTIGTILLNGGNDITLTENVTTTIQATATITDTSYTDISSIEGKIYRSGVGTSCSADDNNCYSDSSCATSSCSGKSCTATCEYEVWFHTDPTDAGDFSAQYWDAWIKAIDTENASSTATSAGVEVNTLRALDLSTNSISFGSMDKGTTTGTLNQVNTTTATGNEAIDVYLYGERMEKDPWEDLDHEIATSSSAILYGGNGENPVVSQIDSTHYLVVWRGINYDGWSAVLEVNTSDWSVSSTNAFEFDPVYGRTSGITQIDSGHYLVVYSGNSDANPDGRSVILSVNTSTWAVSTSSANFQFESATTTGAVVSQIDSTHYLVVYQRGRLANNDPGGAVVLNVSTSTWAISTSSAYFEFESVHFHDPDIAKIDSTHFLVTYDGYYQDGWSAVLEVDTSAWVISTSSANFEFDPSSGRATDIASIDSDPYHFLVVYRGYPTAILLGVNSSTWAVSTSSAPFDIGDSSEVRTPHLGQIDSDHYLVTHVGPGYDGWSSVLEIDTSSWAISTSSAPFEFSPEGAAYTVNSRIDSSHFLVVYRISGGHAQILNPYLSNVIPVEYTEYATSGVNYASGTDLTTSATTTLELDMSKPTSHPSTSTDEIYLGLEIPSYIQKGSYSGTTTLEAKAD